MKFFDLTVIVASTMLFASCSDKKANDPVKISQTFKDEAVITFVQVEGVVAKSILEKGIELFLIPSAVAGEGSIKCFTGQKVKFEIKVLNADLDIEATCAQDIEMQIRRELLKSLMGKELVSHIGGGNLTVPGKERYLDLSTVTTEDNFWNKPLGEADAGGIIVGCKDSFTFNNKDGSMIIDLAAVSDSFCSLSEGDESNNYCGTGNTDTDLKAMITAKDLEDADTKAAIAICKPLYRQNLVFRFKDGFLEYAPTEKDLEDKSGSEYNSFKIDP